MNLLWFHKNIPLIFVQVFRLFAEESGYITSENLQQFFYHLDLDFDMNKFEEMNIVKDGKIEMNDFLNSFWSKFIPKGNPLFFQFFNSS